MLRFPFFKFLQVIFFMHYNWLYLSCKDFCILFHQIRAVPKDYPLSLIQITGEPIRKETYFRTNELKTNASKSDPDEK